MRVAVVAADPDRAETLVRAAQGAGHVVERAAASFARAVDALQGADVVVADFAQDEASAAWAVAFALARGRLVVATVPLGARLPMLVRDNPSPYQRVVAGDGERLARDVTELLRV